MTVPRIKVPRAPARVDHNFGHISAAPEEGLTGKVMGMSASDLEERTARAIVKVPDWGFLFRQRLSPLTHQLSGRLTNIAGEIEIDFICTKGSLIQPIMIQGEYSHFKAPWQEEEDLIKIEAVDMFLKAYNAKPTLRVPDRKEDLYKLTTQDWADKTIRDILESL